MHKRRRVRKSKWVNKNTHAEELRFEEERPRRERNFMGPLVFVIVSVIAAILLFGSLGIYFRLKTENLARTNGNGSVSVSGGSDLISPEIEWTGELPSEVLEGFMSATKLDEKIRWFDHLNLVGEDARRFFTDGPGAREKIATYRLVKSFRRDNGEYRFVIHAVLEDGGSRIISLNMRPEGPKIDFGIYARHCSQSWEDLLSGRATVGGEMRIVLDPGTYFGTYYVPPFTDETKWRCLRGTSPELDSAILLYFRIGSPEAETLLHRPGLPPLSHTVLKIASRDGSHKRRAFEIVEVLRTDWYTVTE